MTLLYKLTNNDDFTNSFHGKYNNKRYTLSLIRNTKSFLFVRFTSQNWRYINDINAFVFSLDIIECYFTYEDVKSIYDYSSSGPPLRNSDFNIVEQCSQNCSRIFNFFYS